MKRGEETPELIFVLCRAFWRLHSDSFQHEERLICTVDSFILLMAQQMPYIKAQHKGGPRGVYWDRLALCWDPLSLRLAFLMYTLDVIGRAYRGTFV